MTAFPFPDNEVVSLVYRNHRGEVATRRLRPKHIWFGSTEWHREPQWLLEAFGLDKQAVRDFALRDFMGRAEE